MCYVCEKRNILFFFFYLTVKFMLMKWMLRLIKKNLCKFDKNLCRYLFYISYQLQFAAILSAVYSIVMVIVFIGIIHKAVQDGLCSMTTIFILFEVGVFVISAVLHPQVWHQSLYNLSTITHFN